MRRLGRICTSRSASVVLPVPDAAETMNSSPRSEFCVICVICGTGIVISVGYSTF